MVVCDQLLRRNLPTVAHSADLERASASETAVSACREDDASLQEARVVFLDYEDKLYERSRSSVHGDSAEECAMATAQRPLLSTLSCDDIHLNAGVLQLVEACLQGVAL